MLIILWFISDCRRSRNGDTDAEGATYNNGRAEKDRERVSYEDKCQKYQAMLVCCTESKREGGNSINILIEGQ